MGQCMEESSSRAREHPFLGALQQESIDNRLYFKLVLGIFSEEHYIEWSKKINKLRYNPELKDYVYTPIKEELKMSRAACQGSNCLELLLDPFDQTLHELLTSNIKSHHYVSQSFLGGILLLLSKYIKYHSQKNLEMGPLVLHNILLMKDAKLKIIPEQLLCNTILRPGYEIEIDQGSPLGYTQENMDHTVNQIYIAGLICLCLADLIEAKRFYSEKTKQWRQITHQEKMDALKNIEMRYSPLLVQLLQSMIVEDEDKQMSASELVQKLEVFECELMVKKQLESMIGLGITMGTPLRTSNIGQTKLNNNSNLLKLSALKYDPTDKASTNMQYQEEEDELAQSQALSIL